MPDGNESQSASPTHSTLGVVVGCAMDPRLRELLLLLLLLLLSLSPSRSPMETPRALRTPDKENETARPAKVERATTEGNLKQDAVLTSLTNKIRR
jgi:hypothetical protein